MIAVDASTVVDLLVADDERGEWARSTMLADLTWAAPDFVLAEVFSAVRGLHRGGHVTTARAEGAVDALGRLRIELVPTARLLGAMWRLRDAVGAYDAGYVAVAIMFDCPLVTADARLARGAARWCQVATGP
ncbi:type II toxin-antitoxin system VapC family toxin [Mobilicoccus massiliensis]|uniref:type II toxin-antitoxin system VapC family toxin n=1 Tax=Mobilicoccus massiliensis TaxID=1522310 RepID=UPI00058DE254|nr:type II toxin-antitoxin system VapC family toxin [Mobilicoccus massiliensis]